MNGTSAVSILDASDPAAVLEYEAAFHSAFGRAVGNRLIRKLWNWDDEGRRLATRIPYTDQLVYLARDAAGKIAVAAGINVVMREFQSSAFGFSPTSEAVEVLTFFSVPPFDLRTTMGFWVRVAEDLRGRGFRTALATTAQRPLRAYIRIGWQRLAEAEIEGERRYFLRFDLAGTVG